MYCSTSPLKKIGDPDLSISSEYFDNANSRILKLSEDITEYQLANFLNCLKKNVFNIDSTNFNLIIDNLKYNRKLFIFSDGVRTYSNFNINLKNYKYFETLLDLSQAEYYKPDSCIITLPQDTTVEDIDGFFANIFENKHYCQDRYQSYIILKNWLGTIISNKSVTIFGEKIYFNNKLTSTIKIFQNIFTIHCLLITKITFGNLFNDKITGCLPNTITEVKFGINFNQEITTEDLPNIKKIKINEKYPHPIEELFGEGIVFRCKKDWPPMPSFSRNSLNTLGVKSYEYENNKIDWSRYASDIVEPEKIYFISKNDVDLTENNAPYYLYLFLSYYKEFIKK